MPLREFVVQFKTRKNLRLTIKTLLFVLNSSKGDNVENLFCSCVVLEFDDSCYLHVDAKLYCFASFSTRNSTLNTSLH